ncbi:MAG: FmdB family transcriptional regulator [Chromatiales bacterium 21-64-14]|nr:MAG: FmdB family transcriptional regulator [Chromatiales bacterium 21-64-14]HQU15985.1 zinc ribbon domain-containing protein [Gammaproteobacteria bacterium]
MPIYEYRCTGCGHELEAIQKMSDDPLLDCPACGKPTLQKLISAAGFRLKGGGWYETDFKSGHKKNVVESDGTKSEGKAKSEPAGDAKRDPKKKTTTPTGTE